MPKPKAYVNYNKCNPRLCPDGICLAAQECELGILFQNEAYDPPETTGSPCKGCFKCLLACPARAIVKM